MKFVVTKPPTTNHIYGFTSRGGFARSYITKEGKIWFTENEASLRKVWHGKKSIETPLEVWIVLYTSRDRDIDGSLKPVLDVLQHAEIIKNDSQIYKMDVEKIKCKTGEDRLEIEIMGF